LQAVDGLLWWLLDVLQKQIKRENVQDSTRQKIFDLEKLVFFTRITYRALVVIFG